MADFRIHRDVDGNITCECSQGGSSLWAGKMPNGRIFWSVDERQASPLTTAEVLELVQENLPLALGAADTLVPEDGPPLVRTGPGGDFTQDYREADVHNRVALKMSLTSVLVLVVGAALAVALLWRM